MLLKKISIIVMILISSQFIAKAQLESNIWYFGNKAGISFTNSPPAAIINNQMSTYEGCASICNSTGNLQFYTDGATVWNKNHLIMDSGTGLNGSSSSTQSSIIIPKPSNTNLYYIFTVDAEENNFGANGLQYSIVDISFNGGLGKVITKNVELIKPTPEKLTVAKHYNNIDYWVITHGVDNSNYYSFLLTASGINSTPVISSAGLFQNDSIDLMGYLKTSNNSKKLASAKYFSETLEVLNFNNSNGVVSNPIQIGNIGKFYGIEFSPDNNKLYTSIYNTSSIYQYNLLAPNIATSKIVVSNDNMCCGGALQIGLDKKIYFSKYGKDSLGVINNPDNISCNFVRNAISLNGRKCQFGLPNIFSGLIIKNTIPPVSSFITSANTICQCENIVFTNTTPPPFTAQKWQINGQVFATSFDTNYTFNNTGNYSISLIVMNDTISDTSKVLIIVNPIKETSIHPLLCQNETYSIGIHNYSISGIYSDTLSTYLGCDSIVTTYLTVKELPIVDLGEDITLCKGIPFTLNAFSLAASYLWQDGSTLPTFNVSHEGWYWVKTSLNSCSKIDSIYITIDENCNTLYVPNTFAPNGLNTIFKPLGKFSSDTEYYLVIYNRWGQLIFESKDPEMGWDGRFNGNMSQPGVYVYYIKIKYGGQSKTFEKTGNLTLFD
ncbi:MAG: gliding motility-associated C-terminal domain-containing protein [Bacteroidota bacterium]